MFKLSFLLIFTFCCTVLHAQPPAGQHTITAITVVDDKGKPLVMDEWNIEILPRLQVYRTNTVAFSGTYRKDEDDDHVNFNNWAGKPAAVHPPFSNDHFLLSGPAREFFINYCGEDSCEEMRVILLNNKSRTDKSRTTVYCIDTIVFRPGTYEIDCSKTSSVKNAVYDSILNLRVYAVKPQLKPRENIYIPAKAFRNYYITGYSFPGNNRFNYMNSGCSNTTTVGNGEYELSRSDVKFIYTTPGGRIKPIVEVKQDNNPAPNSIRGLVMNEKGDPIPGATIMRKGIRSSGTYTKEDGSFEWKMQQADLSKGIVLQVFAMGYQTKEIPLSGDSSWYVKCIMDNTWVYYQDSGHVAHGIFTDYTDDYIGIYWLQPGEIFSFNNQQQMEQRVLYYNKRIRAWAVVCPD